ncbi:MAG TPA: hypothetical protein DHR80_06195, partial [Thalassospira lucentensis]
MRVLKCRCFKHIRSGAAVMAVAMVMAAGMAGGAQGGETTQQQDFLRKLVGHAHGVSANPTVREIAA